MLQIMLAEEGESKLPHDKHEQVPEILYKYLTYERIDVLKNQSIRFTQPADLNDPFEMSPQIPDFAPIDTPMGTPEKIEDGVYRTTPRINFGINAAEGLMRTFDDIKKLKEIKSIVNDIGVLSLSETNDNLLMWSHYAGNHSGFAIGFRTDSEFIKRRFPSISNVRNPAKVLYTNARPPFSRDSEVNLESAIPYLNVKSLDWAYEKEWRALRCFSDAEFISNAMATQKGNKIYLYRCPHEAISEIIIGANADKRLIVKAANIISTYPSLSHVKVYRAACNFNNYGIELLHKEIVQDEIKMQMSLELNGRTSFGL